MENVCGESERTGMVHLQKDTVTKVQDNNRMEANGADKAEEELFGLPVPCY